MANLTGKRIVEMQHSIERVRYMDIEKLTAHGKALYLHHMRIAAIAEQHGIPEVSRWVPRDVCALLPVYSPSLTHLA